MNVETVREYCLSKKGTTESFPFDKVSLVIKVMNKMFALIDLEEANHIALKCDPEKAIELRERYSGIEGAYHFNKKYWNSVRFDSDVDDRLMKELIDHSYDEVIKKFTKKLRAEYIASVRMNLRTQLDNINIQEKDGSIVNLGEKYGKKKKTH